MSPQSLVSAESSQARAGLPSGLPARDDGALPPATNRGVEFQSSFTIDWLSVTIHSHPDFVASVALALVGIEGDLSSFALQPHGGLGFRSLYVHSYGLRLLANPPSGEYCSVQMSGSVSSCVHPDDLKRCIESLDAQSIRWNCTRLDLAFDTDLFHPREIQSCIMANTLRSPAERSSLRVVSGLDDDVNYTVYFGSRSSERMLRSYRKEKTGVFLTRVEMEYKGLRALRVLFDLCAHDAAVWSQRAMSHLLDFCDFHFDAWRAFTAGCERAMLTINRLASSFERTRQWLWQSCASAFAMLWNIDGRAAIDALVLHGIERFNSRHRSLVSDSLSGVYSPCAFAPV